MFVANDKIQAFKNFDGKKKNACMSDHKLDGFPTFRDTNEYDL